MRAKRPILRGMLATNPLNCWSTGTHYCCHSPGENFPSCVPKILVKHSGGVVADTRSRPVGMTSTMPQPNAVVRPYRADVLRNARGRRV